MTRAVRTIDDHEAADLPAVVVEARRAQCEARRLVRCCVELRTQSARVRKASRSARAIRSTERALRARARLLQSDRVGAA